ncbi:unnamed protein product [Timema podura]|uniref:Uncharacterized protein n=1 Tax=Timema podura TaxID=61482 RepID=A0ABN7NRD9_TIMPD|nr:unnamed protein product [Timema podura]
MKPNSLLDAALFLNSSCCGSKGDLTSCAITDNHVCSRHDDPPCHHAASGAIPLDAEDPPPSRSDPSLAGWMFVSYHFLQDYTFPCTILKGFGRMKAMGSLKVSTLAFLEPEQYSQLKEKCKGNVPTVVYFNKGL